MALRPASPPPDSLLVWVLGACSWEHQLLQLRPRGLELTAPGLHLSAGATPKHLLVRKRGTSP